ncbi:MAG: ABC transporter permease [Clostridia bacterium]|nr:ABC transporter permease [Clostridia bacterium]
MRAGRAGGEGEAIQAEPRRDDARLSPPETPGSREVAPGAPAAGRGRLARKLLKSPLTVTGAAVVALYVLLALAAGWLAPYGPADQELAARLAPPSPAHWLGTDSLGRDILSRILYGARIDLVVAVSVVVVTALAGSGVGLLAGWAGGWVDEALMRFTDMFLAFPSLILAMAIAAVLGPSLPNTLVAIAAVQWPAYARLMRGQVLALREALYVEAARSLGARPGRILLRHLLPNAVAPILVQATLDMGGVIMTAAGLSFIGFGAQPPAPEWGLMVSDGRRFIMNQWWVATFPGLAILLLVLGFNLVGDGLRDVLDPRWRR